MLPFTLLLLAIPLIFITLVIQAIHNLCFNPLRKVPGPTSHAASRLPYILAVLRGQLPYHFHKLHEKYGPVVRTAPNEVSFIDEEACKALYARKDASGYVFPKNYDTWNETTNYFMHTVFLAGHENHARIRKAFNPAFSEKMVRVHEGTITGNVDRFVGALRKDVGGEKHVVIDLDERFHWLAFDTVAEFVFGTSFDCLGSKTYRAWLRRFSMTWTFIAIISSMKQVVSIVTKLLTPTGLLQSRVDALNPIDAKVEQLMEKDEEKEVDERQTLLSIGKSSMATDSDKPQLGALSRLEVTANATLFTVAGTDTVATVVPSVLYLLLRHPEPLKRLLAEIRDISGETGLTIQRAREMPYLTACIEEAMRLYPAVPEGLPRIVPGWGKEICGYWMPSGTNVQVSNYAAYRSPKNFEEPNAFIPERWLPDAEGKPSDAGKGVFHPFSTGPRGCMARNFAMAEISLALIKLLWHFDVSLDSDEDWMDQRCFLLWERKPLKVKLTERA